MDSRVLVVDDEQIITLHLEDLLASMGYTVVGTASSGQEGIDKARELMPDIIFMDIVMPGKKDGITAAKEIIEDLDIPVIFLTAYGEGSIIDKAKAAKPYAFLHKPFQTHELRSAIEISLTRKGLENQLAESEKRYRTLVEETRDGVAILQDGVFIFANAALKELLGNPKDLDVSPAKDFFDGNFAERMSRISEDGECDSSLDDFILKRESGDMIPVEGNSTCIVYNGRPAVLAFFRNTEERKKGEALIEFMVRNLNEKNQFLISSTEKVISDIGGVAADDLVTVQNGLFQSSDTLGKVYRLLLALQSRGDPAKMDMDSTISNALDTTRSRHPEKQVRCRVEPISLPQTFADEAVRDCFEFIFERIVGNGPEDVQIDIFGEVVEDGNSASLEIKIKDESLSEEMISSADMSGFNTSLDEDSLIVSILGYIMERSYGGFRIGRWKKGKDEPFAYTLTVPIFKDNNT